MTDAPATSFAKDQLKAIVERVERMEEEKKAIADDIKDIFAEAKAHGFDVKALRTIIRLRKQDADERKEQEAILDVYMHALGMLADTPLGRAAIERSAPKPKRSDTDGSGGSAPPAGSTTPQSAPVPAAASAASPDGLDIPTFLRRKPEVPGQLAQGP
jgi:uncharacterized protein (UPF0335 family)